MPDYVPTGHHVFSGRNRIDNEMVSLTPDPAVVAAPTEEELNIVPSDDREVDDVDELVEDDGEFIDEAADDSSAEEPEEAVDEEEHEYEAAESEEQGSGETPEEIAARLAGDRVKAQMDNLEIAAKIASEESDEDAAPAEETPEEIAARLAADRVHAQEMNLEVARSQQ